MTYAGLTTADKGALLDAKARGANWIARDENFVLGEFIEKPNKGDKYWIGQSYDENWGVDDDNVLKFIKWSDAEPVNIDLALAQIAEMESAEKPCPYCSTDAFSPSRVGLYGKNGFSPFHIYFAGGTARDGEQFDYCPKCARRINTEGERT